MRKQFIGLVVLSIMAGAFAHAGPSESAKCIARVKKAGCYLSGNDAERIDDNVQKCKQVQTKDNTLEVFLLKNSDKFVVVRTDSPNGQYCPTVKYSLDPKGIKDMKIINGKITMVSNSGAVYLMNGFQDTYEMLNAKGKSYTNVQEIKGAAGGQNFIIIGPGYANEFSPSDIQEKIRAGKFRYIQFRYTTTQRSLFRDE